MVIHPGGIEWPARRFYSSVSTSFLVFDRPQILHSKKENSNPPDDDDHYGGMARGGPPHSLPINDHGHSVAPPPLENPHKKWPALNSAPTSVPWAR